MKARLAHLMNTWSSGGFRALARRIHSQTTMYLFEQSCADVSPPQSIAGGLEFREATADDIPAIGAAWPEDFGVLGSNPQLRQRTLVRRFEEHVPCFVTSLSGDLFGAVWAEHWAFDKALPPELQGRPAVELVSLFVNYQKTNLLALPPEVRKTGVAKDLLTYSMSQMGQKGVAVVYGRVLPARKPAIRANEKAGLRKIGLLTNGYRFGRRFCRFEKLPASEAGDAATDA
jgi:hypothetical protein